jgi:hypothetical protein
MSANRHHRSTAAFCFSGMDLAARRSARWSLLGSWRVGASVRGAILRLSGCTGHNRPRTQGYAADGPPPMIISAATVKSGA